MTKAEFKRWTECTADSKTHWAVDEVTYANRKEYLIYVGGRNGWFITIDRSGLLVMGTYKGAVPHIGEALFKPSFEKMFPSQGEALSRCIECGGEDFLRGLMTSPIWKKRSGGSNDF